MCYNCYGDNMKFIKELTPYIVIVLVVVLFRTFIATPVRVDGKSMNPTLNNGEILILNKLDRKYERMDIVVFNYNNERLIKRVIGLPGESVKFEDNKLYINDTLVKDYSDSVKTKDFEISNIKDKCYFLVGDNRYDSYDSRYIGCVNESDILGTISFRVIPFTNF